MFYQTDGYIDINSINSSNVECVVLITATIFQVTSNESKSVYSTYTLDTCSHEYIEDIFLDKKLTLNTCNPFLKLIDLYFYNNYLISVISCQKYFFQRQL